MLSASKGFLEDPTNPLVPTEVEMIDELVLKGFQVVGTWPSNAEEYLSRRLRLVWEQAKAFHAFYFGNSAGGLHTQPDPPLLPSLPAHPLLPTFILSQIYVILTVSPSPPSEGQEEAAKDALCIFCQLLDEMLVALAESGKADMLKEVDILRKVWCSDVGRYGECVRRRLVDALLRWSH
ncbi:hypothetical protein BT69DRAFT_1321339 [Atractiella rhizophila]|nr:hypothetical protein BT69DRAFT_1321339 [Atractiella rhizophila]